MRNMKVYGIAALYVILSACSSEKKEATNANPAANAIPVSAFTVAEETVQAQKSYPGRIVALNETELRSEVNGYITKIYVSDGALVQKGQLLYEIDKQRYQSAYQQAKASLNIVNANLEKAKRDLARYESLKKQDAIAQQILDNAYTDVNTAQAQVVNAQAALSTAALNLNRATVRAPFSGSIGISQVRLGALVSAGTTLLNTLSATHPMALEVAIDEQSIAQIQALKQSKMDSLFTMQLPNGEIYPETGHLSVLDRAVNPETGTLNIRVNFANPKGLLKVGMSGNLRIKSNDGGTQIVIPSIAISEQLSNYFVYVISDSSTVSQRSVQLGPVFKDKIVIKSGLKVGERIVVEGLQNPLLREGAKIQLDN